MLMQGFPPPLEQRVTLANWQTPPYNRWSFQHVREVVPTARVSRGRGPVSELAHGLEAVTAALRDLGSGLGRPLLTLQTLTFSAIPDLRLTTRGLLAVKSRDLVPVLL